MDIYPPPPKEYLNRGAFFVPVPQYESTRESVAYHEAGHTLLSILYDYPINYVFINDVMDVGIGNGALFTGHPVDSTLNDLKANLSGPLEDLIIPREEDVTDFSHSSDPQKQTLNLAAMLYAGLQAELLYNDIEVAGPVRPYDADHELAAAVLYKNIGHLMPTRYCQLMARSQLSRFWPFVQIIADALVDRGNLSREEVWSLINQAELPDKSASVR